MRNYWKEQKSKEVRPGGTADLPEVAKEACPGAGLALQGPAYGDTLSATPHQISGLGP